MRRLHTRALTGACHGLLALAISLRVGATEALAQGRQTGTLRGTARDSTEARLPGVTVTVVSASLQGTRNGEFTIRFNLSASRRSQLTQQSR